MNDLVAYVSHSAVVRDQIGHFLEVVRLRLIEFCIAGEHRDVAIAVANCKSAAVLRPAKAVERSASLVDLLAHDGNLDVAIDVPHVDESVCVA